MIYFKLSLANEPLFDALVANGVVEHSVPFYATEKAAYFHMRHQATVRDIIKVIDEYNACGHFADVVRGLY